MASPRRVKPTAHLSHIPGRRAYAEIRTRDLFLTNPGPRLGEFELILALASHFRRQDLFNRCEVAT
jgi:hypothetical protein